MFRIFWSITTSLLTIFFAVVTFTSIAVSLMNQGLESPVVSRIELVIEAITLPLDGFIKIIISFLPFGLANLEPPSWHAEAAILSSIVTHSYIASMQEMDKETGKDFENRRYIAAPIIVVFGLSAVGLSLLFTITRNALKSQEELDLASSTVLKIGRVSMFVVLMMLIEVGVVQ